MDPQPKIYQTLNEFIEKTTQLLIQEQQQQKQMFQDMVQHKNISQIQDQGFGLSNMTIFDSKEGFYGKINIKLTKAYYSEKNKIQIPDYCKLDTGDNVAVYHDNTFLFDGTISKRTHEKIKVSIIPNEEYDNYEGLKVNIILKWNQVTYNRYFDVLKELEDPHNLQVINTFFPTRPSKQIHTCPKYQNKKLNEKQKQAISRSLEEPCHLIHGPPGTGKTTTVCELIKEYGKLGKKVLACAPSNIGVDNIVEGIRKSMSCVRIGNPARITEGALDCCLDYLIGKKQGSWKKQLKLLEAAKKKLSKTHEKIERKKLNGEIKGIKKEINMLQQQVLEEIVTQASVVCATNVGAADRIFKLSSLKKFDLVIIDECAQALEVSCWIPLLKGKRVVLAGDHKQLSPTVKFQQNSLLSYTLFSRAMNNLPHIGSTMLEVQYRMNRKIMGWSNKQFYQGKLQADQTVQNHELKQLYKKIDDEAIILLIDTAGCKIGEEGEAKESKYNQGEADIILYLYKKFLSYDVNPKDLAILTPYSKQVSLIKNNVNEIGLPNIEISTVDGIQGRQKQCILISLVRSNPSHQIGFLKDLRRMNVAITRARRMLILVGDSDSLRADKDLSALVDWIDEHGSIQSALQLSEHPEIRFGLGKIEQTKQIKPIQKKKKTKKKKKEVQEIIKPIKKQNPNIFQKEDTDTLKFKKILEEIDDELVLENLDGFQRRMVHEIAQELGYWHQTSENKKKLIVRKNYQEKQIENIIKEEEEKKQNKIISKPQEKQTVQESVVKKVKQKKPKRPKQEKEQEQDIDALLNQFLQENKPKNICFKCEKKLGSLGIVCKFCRREFCQYHSFAQEHGCDEEARNYARKPNIDNFIKEGTKKMKEKLKQQEEQRKKKKKQKQK